MNRNHHKLAVAHHEVGHAAFFVTNGVPLDEVYIEYDPAMAIGGSWGGEVVRANDADLDGSILIASLFAGPLAEARYKANVAHDEFMYFDLEDDAQSFLDMQLTQPGSRMTAVSLVNEARTVTHNQELLIAAIHSDIMQTRRIAHNLNRPDALQSLLRFTRETLDSWRIWSAIQTTSERLYYREHIPGDEFSQMFDSALHESTKLEAFYHWTRRGKPLWDDLHDWFDVTEDA
tara:strand:+ start:974 stop:1669 length:696 start_codon:yes stop_codon:yes gene_type:complete